jgi:CRISPR-associated protein Cmr1
MTSGTVNIECKPLTPVWTGDAHQKSGQLRETSLVGSLRWWYEAILRGVGFYACDPSTGSCVYEESDKLKGLCLACQLFGGTGYSRRFRLEIEAESTSGQTLEVRLKNPGIADHRGWRIPKELTKPFRLKFVPLFLEGFDTADIGLALRLIERFGAFGAKTSQGQGMVRFKGTPEADFAKWKELLTGRPHRQINQPPNSPSLDNMVGVVVEVKPQRKDWWQSIRLEMNGFGLSDQSTWIPSAPAVRAWMRAEPCGSFSVKDRHRLMGWVDPKGRTQPKGSDIFVSHLYREQDRWRMRIFGLLPKSGDHADRRLRELLAAGGLNELKGKLAQALGLTTESIAAVEPYPSKLENFFS